MKKILAMVLACLLTVSSVGNLSAQDIPGTNLDGVSILPVVNAPANGLVTWPNSTTTAINRDELTIYVNGSLLREFAIDGENISVPLRAVAEALGAEVTWQPSVRTVTINDGIRQIKLAVDGIYAYIANNADASAISYDEEITLETAPQVLRNDRVYISLSDIGLLFTASAYAANEDMYFISGDEVMIDRYGEDAVLLSEAEAREIARQQLVIAYEQKYGEFVEWSEVDESESANVTNADIMTQNLLRKSITVLKLAGENSRFYKFAVYHEYWVDKYIGELYSLSGTFATKFTLVDPYAEDALILSQ